MERGGTGGTITPTLSPVFLEFYLFSKKFNRKTVQIKVIFSDLPLQYFYSPLSFQQAATALIQLMPIDLPTQFLEQIGFMRQCNIRVGQGQKILEELSRKGYNEV